MSIEQKDLVAALGKVEGVVKEVARRAGFGEAALKLVEEDGCDPCLFMDGTPFHVVAFDEEHVSARARFDHRVAFMVCAESHDPGVRYHADGSGTPPSVDVVELTDPTASILPVAQDLLKEWAKGSIDEAVQSLAEEEDARGAIEAEARSAMEAEARGG